MAVEREVGDRRAGRAGERERGARAVGDRLAAVDPQPDQRAARRAVGVDDEARHGRPRPRVVAPARAARAAGVDVVGAGLGRRRSARGERQREQEDLAGLPPHDARPIPARGEKLRLTSRRAGRRARCGPWRRACARPCAFPGATGSCSSTNTNRGKNAIRMNPAFVITLSFVSPQRPSPPSCASALGAPARSSAKASDVVRRARIGRHRTMASWSLPQVLTPLDRPLIAAWRCPRPLKSQRDSCGSASLPGAASDRPGAMTSGRNH